MAIGKFESNPSLFAGQGDLVIFDEIEDYSAATLSSLKNPVSLGQIVQDSTSWDGDDVSIDNIKDEQGNIITARVTAGTLAFSFEIASTSGEMVKKFLKGKSVAGASVDGFSSVTGATGFGTSLPVITVPVAIINDGLNRAWLYPKAKITSSLSYSDGLWRIKASVLAETIDNGSLMTGMVIDGKADTGEEAGA
jgi:hypothetical protein